MTAFLHLVWYGCPRLCSLRMENRSDVLQTIKNATFFLVVLALAYLTLRKTAQ